MGARPVLLHYYSLQSHPRHFFLDCREKLVDELHLVPLGVDGAVELVLFPPLASLRGSFGRFEGTNAPYADLAVEIVAQVRPSICHDDHDLREARLLCCTRGDPGITSLEKIRIFYFVLRRKASSFVQVDDVSLVKKIADCLVHLIADEVDPVLPLGLGKRRFDVASNLCSPFFLKSSPYGLGAVVKPDILELIGHLPERERPILLVDTTQRRDLRWSKKRRASTPCFTRETELPRFVYLLSALFPLSSRKLFADTVGFCEWVEKARGRPRSAWRNAHGDLHRHGVTPAQR